MRLAPLLLASACTALLPACAMLRVDKAAKVATASTSQWLCGAAFIAGLDPAPTFQQQVLALPGMGLVGWGLNYQVDAERREVSASIAGTFKSRAVFRDRLGCVVLPDEGGLDPAPLPPPTPPEPALLAPIAGPALVPPATPALAAAMDLAFGGGGPDPHHTQALVVLHQGRLVGERYRSDVGPQTPLLGFSMNKSLLNALAGAMVLQGRLDVQAPAPLAAWRHSHEPGKRSLNAEHLLRQNSGLDLPQDESGFDASSQIMFTVRDKAAVSAAAPLSAPPGSRWNYTDPHYILLARVLHEAAGGTAASTLQFARQALFEPLGLHSVTMEFDATGAPVGAASTYASARDWARFGQLYLDDGIAGGRRLLPEGWVRWSTTPTPGTGYGAGFWLNSVPGQVPGWGIPWGLPKAPPDTFFARGFLGQFVVVVPSRRVVIVRLGTSQVYTREGNIAVAMDQWVAAILQALAAGAPPALQP